MKKNLKISKGIIFIAIGLLFLFVTFYNVVESVNILGDEVSFFHFANYYNAYEFSNNTLFDFVRPTILNYLFSILFIILGTIEIIESGILKKAGDDNAY